MKNILIADDDRTFREALVAYLYSKLKNYNLLTAEDGEKAIEILEATHVSLILTDLVMPKADGYELIDYVTEHNPDIPVIIMTSSWSVELVALLQKMPHILFIEKPLHLEDIDRMIIGPLMTNDQAPAGSAAN